MQMRLRLIGQAMGFRHRQVALLEACPPGSQVGRVCVPATYWCGEVVMRRARWVGSRPMCRYMAAVSCRIEVRG
jgi:hypothetical protein